MKSRKKKLIYTRTHTLRLCKMNVNLFCVYKYIRYVYCCYETGIIYNSLATMFLSYNAYSCIHKNRVYKSLVVIFILCLCKYSVDVYLLCGFYLYLRLQGNKICSHYTFFFFHWKWSHLKRIGHIFF